MKGDPPSEFVLRTKHLLPFLKKVDARWCFFLDFRHELKNKISWLVNLLMIRANWKPMEFLLFSGRLWKTHIFSEIFATRKLVDLPPRAPGCWRWLLPKIKCLYPKLTLNFGASEMYPTKKQVASIFFKHEKCTNYELILILGTFHPCEKCSSTGTGQSCPNR